MILPGQRVYCKSEDFEGWTRVPITSTFILGHKATATLRADNALEMLQFRGSKLPRLDLAFYALTHANEHYGQMVVYLRLSGIIRRVSRPK